MSDQQPGQSASATSGPPSGAPQTFAEAPRPSHADLWSYLQALLAWAQAEWAHVFEGGPDPGPMPTPAGAPPPPPAPPPSPPPAPPPAPPPEPPPSPAPPSPPTPAPGPTPPSPPPTSGDVFWVIDPSAASLVTEAQLAGFLADLEADHPNFARDWPHVGNWTHTLVTDPAQIPAGAIVSTLTNTLDEAPGALAYHSVDDNGVPFLRTGVGVCQANGVDWRSAADHEVKETYADPSCVVVVTDPDGNSVAYEVCDPVEGHSYPAGPGGSPMSDYVNPAWFAQPNPDADTDVDLMGDVDGPWKIAADGYAVVGGADVSGPGQAFEAEHVRYGSAFPEFRRRSVEALAAGGVSPRRKPPR